MNELAAAFESFLQPEVFGIVLLSAMYGIFVGAIPGLTATMAVALMVPLTFTLSDQLAIAAIVTLEACAIFAGDIPTVLLRLPGTPASAAYVDDGYALTRKGRQFEALGTSLVFSVTGGLIGALLLILFAPLVAEVALEFSSLENFWLTLLGLSCAVIVSRGSRLKGALALFIGLLFATVGLSAVHTSPRFTFGNDELITGIHFIPAMIGLFGVSEILRNVLSPSIDSETLADAGSSKTGLLPSIAQAIRETLLKPMRQLFRRWHHVLRSSIIGSAVGMLPGAGADIGAWMSYAASKKASKKPEEYGVGSIEGLSDATSANNSALAGAWMPTLILGIPGDSVTAIVIGVLLMKNITPGPTIIEEQGDLVYFIYITFILANLMLLPLGFVAVRLSSRLLRVPRRILMPIILLFCVVGSYSLSGSYFDVLVMLVMGLVGFGLEAVRVPLGPVVLGLILGGSLEERFIQNWTKYNSLFDFFGQPFSDTPRPWATGLGLACIALWIGPSLLSLLRGRDSDPDSGEPDPGRPATSDDDAR